MSLYRKIRPQTFEEVIGNEASIDTLKKCLAKKEKPHAYVFSGASGTGKTTLARIAAKMLGANELSINEVNSADNRGIETVRDIIQKMKYIPPGSGVNIYIIDEAHGITGDAKRALLKPLEDTPKHCYFFLCTTNPTKLFQGDEGKAIKTRCTHIQTMPVSDEEMYIFLRRLIKKEGFEISKDITRELSENCEGSPRQALVLLEQISEMENENQMREIISVGEEIQKEVIELCRVLLNAKSFKPVTTILKSLKNEDPEKIRYAVLGYMNSVLLNSTSHKAAVIIECFSEPFYNVGKAGLTLACYQVFSDE